MKWYRLFDPSWIAEQFTFYGGGGGGKGAPDPAPPPAPVPPPPPPTVEDADVKAEDSARRDRMRKGAASTILTNGGKLTSDTGSTSSAVKTLLGS